MLKGWRRVLVAILTLAPLPGAGPSGAEPVLVGVLYPGSPALDALEPFRRGLRELGYVEGRDLKIEWRFANGNEQLDQLAVELVINRRAANALGLTIPPSLLLRADRVIE